MMQYHNRAVNDQITNIRSFWWIYPPHNPITFLRCWTPLIPIIIIIIILCKNVLTIFLQCLSSKSFIIKGPKMKCSLSWIKMSCIQNYCMLMSLTLAQDCNKSPAWYTSPAYFFPKKWGLFPQNVFHWLCGLTNHTPCKSHSAVFCWLCEMLCSQGLLIFWQIGLPTRKTALNTNSGGNFCSETCAEV